MCVRMSVSLSLSLSVCVCVCVCERERERERVCASVPRSLCVNTCVRVGARVLWWLGFVSECVLCICFVCVCVRACARVYACV